MKFIHSLLLALVWRDDLADRLVFRKKEAGWDDRTEIQTFFDYIDADEGRG